MHIKGYTKFNIGDLVCLSAYGNARDHNWSWHGHWGIVTGLTDRKHYPYRVEFLSKGKTNRFSIFHPRELKHFKPNKGG
jgi:hypothetical protein